MATYRDMIDRVLDATGRAPNSHRGEAGKLVNEVYLQTVERARLNTKTVTLNLTIGQGDYALSTAFGVTDLVAIRSLAYTLNGDTSASPLQPVSFDQVAAYRQGATTTTGLGIYYAVWGQDTLTIWPAPTSADVVALTYDFRPSLMTLDDDTPDALPIEFHYVIEDGAISRSARYKPALGQLSAEYSQRYQQGIADLCRWRNHRQGAMPRQAVVGRKRHLLRRGNSVVYSGDE